MADPEVKTTLYIGDKNLSSWSLRPYLALNHAKVPFEEVLIRLNQPDSPAKIGEVSPSGRVPVLDHGEVRIWESLAICEYVAETWPAARLWPEAAPARAVARAVSNEMHAGFSALRANLPMNIRGQGLTPKNWTLEVERDVERIEQIWASCRARFGQGGPFLFGPFTIADAMFAPVVTRFTSYQVDVEPETHTYMEAIWSLDSMKAWRDAAYRE